MSEVFQAGFGASLKAAREAKNMALADVAAKLKLTSRQVEALEEEDFDHLPSEVFVRGFVRNYARLVGLEPDSLIAPVDAQVSEVITAPSAGLHVGSNGIRRWLVYPLIVVTVFLVLVAALYHWLRQGEDALISAPPDVTTQALPPLALSPEAPPPHAVAPADEAPALSPVPAPAPAPETEPAPSSNAGQPAPAALPVAPALPASPAPAAPALATNAAPAAKSSQRSMRFEPTHDAWIQVVDGKGNRFSKLVRAGAAESFSGEPPFRLVVGEAAQVKLTYNGHSIDLTPFIGQKVARLTLE